MKTVRFTFTILCFLFLIHSIAFGAFFTHQGIGITRTFDLVSTTVGDSITVTVSFTNSEAYAIKGFYYTEHIPKGIIVNTLSVKIDGQKISDYIFESGKADDIYLGCKFYRWVFETPTGFADDNPINPDASVEIVYSLRSNQKGIFYCEEFNWIGYYRNAPVEQQTAFGYSEDDDKQIISFGNYPMNSNQTYYWFVRTIGNTVVDSPVHWQVLGEDEPSSNLLIVTSDKSTVTVNPDKALYTNGEQVTLTAIPDMGYKFEEWTGTLISTDNPFTFQMNSDTQLQALFAMITPSSEPGIILIREDITGDADPVRVEIFGSTNPVPGIEELLYHATVQNNSQVVFNWDAPVLNPDNSMMILYHMDNRAEFGEGGGLIHDFSGNGRDGVLVSSRGATLEYGDSYGKFGGGFRADGSFRNKAIRVSNDGSFNGLQEFTIAMWAKIDLPVNSNRLFSLGNVNAFDPGNASIVGRLRETRSEIIFQVSDGTTTRQRWSSKSFPKGDGLYHHLAFVFDGIPSNSNDRRMDIYLDGELVNSNLSGNIDGQCLIPQAEPSDSCPIPGSTCLADDGDFYILGYQCCGPISLMNGTIDEFVMYDRALSDSEIQEMTHLSSNQTYYWFMRTKGNTVVDSPVHWQVLGEDEPSSNLLIVTSDKSTVTVNPDKALYTNGEQVTLTAIPDMGYKFEEWTGTLISTDNPFTFQMNSDTQLQALFAMITPSSEPGIILIRKDITGDADPVRVEIFGSTNPVPGIEELLYHATVQNNSQVVFNWDAPVLNPDNSMMILYHMDNRAEFGEGGGLIHDFSNNGRDGVLVSSRGATLEYGDSFGKFGGGFRADGSFRNKAIRVSNDGSFNGLQEFTIAMWVKVDLPVNSNRLFSLGNVNAFDPGNASIVGRLRETRSEIIFQVSDGTTTRQRWSSQTFPKGDGLYHHLAFVFDGIPSDRSERRMDIYLDGELVNGNLSGNIDGQCLIPQAEPSDSCPIPGSTRLNDSGDFYILGYQCCGPISLMNGTIDEFVMYDRALSDSEIQEMTKLL